MRQTELKGCRSPFQFRGWRDIRLALLLVESPRRKSDGLMAGRLMGVGRKGTEVGERVRWIVDLRLHCKAAVRVTSWLIRRRGCNSLVVLFLVSIAVGSRRSSLRRIRVAETIVSVVHVRRLIPRHADSVRRGVPRRIGTAERRFIHNHGGASQNSFLMSCVSIKKRKWRQSVAALFDTRAVTISLSLNMTRHIKMDLSIRFFGREYYVPVEMHK